AAVGPAASSAGVSAAGAGSAGAGSSAAGRSAAASASGLVPSDHTFSSRECCGSAANRRSMSASSLCAVGDAAPSVRCSAPAASLATAVRAVVLPGPQLVAVPLVGPRRSVDGAREVRGRGVGQLVLPVGVDLLRAQLGPVARPRDAGVVVPLEVGLDVASPGG